MIIRSFERKDAQETIKLFKETIRSINLRDYSEKQVEVWSNSITSVEMWEKRLEESVTFVAEINKQIVGFGNINNNREIDLLYVHRKHQGQGIASTFLSRLEGSAMSMGFSQITTEASLTAKPFFESKGYEVVIKQNKVLHGTSFVNFIMEKEI